MLIGDVKITDRARLIGYSHAELTTALLLVFQDVFSVLDEEDRDRAKEKIRQKIGRLRQLATDSWPDPHSRDDKVAELLEFVADL